MTRVHKLEEFKSCLQIFRHQLERIDHTKLLGVHMHEHLKWDRHVNEVVNAWYRTLRTLRKLKNFTDSRLRKRFVESLVLSKRDYRGSGYFHFPDYLMKRLQKMQFSAVRKCVNSISDTVDFGWLSTKESREFYQLKLTFRSLHEPLWPSCLTIQKVTNTLDNYARVISTGL